MFLSCLRSVHKTHNVVMYLSFICCDCMLLNVFNYWLRWFVVLKKKIDQLWYIKIQANTINLSTRLWGINPTNSAVVRQSLVLRSTVLSWILIYRNFSIGYSPIYPVNTYLCFKLLWTSKAYSSLNNKAKQSTRHNIRELKHWWSPANSDAYQNMNIHILAPFSTVLSISSTRFLV